jgi:hypothetical protein
MAIISGSSSSASAGRVVLFDSTLGVAAASIDTGASGIAPGFSVITVYVVGRTTEAVVSSSILARLNADSGANYDQSSIAWASGAVSGSSSVAQTAWACAFPGASMDASSAGSVSIVIPSYDQTTFNKQATNAEGLGSGTANNNSAIMRSFRWRNTAAISRLSITAGSGNLVAGSRLLILGG